MTNALTGTPMARPRQWIALGVVVVVAWVALALPAAFVLTLPSPTLGWLWVGLGLLPGLLGGSLLTWGRSVLWQSGAVGLALLLGLATWHVAPPTHDRIRARAEQVAWPTGWQTVNRLELGNTWCFQRCPEISDFLDLPARFNARSLDQLAGTLAAAGWTRADRPGERQVFRKGRWRAVVSSNNSSSVVNYDVSVTFSGCVPLRCWL